MPSKNPLYLIREFSHCVALLWRDRLGQISLATTTLFWGAGATLQFIVIDWAARALSLNLSQASMLQGVVAVGIALGAVIAAKFVTLRSAVGVLPIGAAMGVVVMVMVFVHYIPLAMVLMIAIGACAGFFVVPMNALLQHRGHVLMGAGHSIAVQNFNENIGILVMVGLYALMVRSGMAVSTAIILFGVFVTGVDGPRHVAASREPARIRLAAPDRDGEIVANGPKFRSLRSHDTSAQIDPPRKARNLGLIGCLANEATTRCRPRAARRGSLSIATAWGPSPAARSHPAPSAEPSGSEDDGLVGKLVRNSARARKMPREQRRNLRDAGSHALRVPAVAERRFHPRADRLPRGIVDDAIDAAIGDDLDVAVRQQQVDEHAGVLFGVPHAQQPEHLERALAWRQFAQHAQRRQRRLRRRSTPGRDACARRQRSPARYATAPPG